MKRITSALPTAPHGIAVGQEGLDALLVTSTSTGDLAVLFIADGIFQLLSEQKPDAVLARDYVATLKLLSLYDIEQRRVYTVSLRERGLGPQTSFVVEVMPLEADALRRELVNYDVILRS